ncbi:MAG: class I SAM-dependent methyltransferase [Phenylobacterium sp.]
MGRLDAPPRVGPQSGMTGEAHPTLMKDAAYLREVQYRDSAKLDARANLHRRHGRDDWPAWIAAQVDWPAGARVLDVGCGGGWFWPAVAAGLPGDLRLTLSDLSPGMVAEAVACAQAAGPGWTVAGQPADAAALPFADGSFDVVLACHMLYHLPDPAAGLAEIARVLAPGGVAVLTTNGRGMLRELWALQAAVWPDQAGHPTHESFSLENGPAMAAAVFERVETRRCVGDLDCDAPGDVLAYLTSSPPGEDASAEALARLAAVTAAAFEAGGGRLRITRDTGMLLCRGARH